MAKTLEEMIEDVCEAMEETLRVRGPSLADQVRKAGRLLPRAVARDAKYLADAIGFVDSPKLSKRIDMGQAARAHRHVLTYLDSVDPAAERRNAALNLAASIAFALLVTAGLLLFVLVQRGFI